jgi:Raf kinase inhibitor-like YbhB/YbcL family protein
MRRAATAALVVALAGCGGGGDSDESAAPPPPASSQKIHLTSPAFRNGDELPEQFTCDGDGISPPLRWSGVPDKARDLALLVEDPDVPVGAFTHWTLWKLPFQPDGSGRVLEGNVAPGMQQGQNDSGDVGWGPACPPEGDGPHHYVFTLHALTRPLDLTDGATATEVRAALTATGSIASGRLEATYDR